MSRERGAYGRVYLSGEGGHRGIIWGEGFGSGQIWMGKPKQTPDDAFQQMRQAAEKLAPVHDIEIELYRHTDKNPYMVLRPA